ncbi:hypothetical protein IWW50_004448 [Coemansia erecta]|nr:hypothetical protein IWW50_004448 [Coemansia erecta]
MNNLLLSPVVLIASISSFAVRGLEINLEWDVSEITKPASSVSSILRFTNDTTPELTEWIPLGWNYGSLSLQNRKDSRSYVVMQLTPPTPRYQAVLGTTSGMAVAKSHDIAHIGSPQVVLEAKVDFTPSKPYQFRVDAHHDIKQNRTTYEGLFNNGEHWVYLGSLVLQHPDSDIGDDVEKIESSSLEDIGNKRDASDIGLSMSVGVAESIPSSRAGDSESDSDSDLEHDSDDDDGEHVSRKDKALYELAVPEIREQTRAPESVAPFTFATPTGMVNRFAESNDSDSDADTEPASSSSFAPAEYGYEPLCFVKNQIMFPQTPAFPRMYSGIRRLDGGDTDKMRAGIFKKFEMRDRLGEMFAVKKAHAHLYDGGENDVVFVRNYFDLSSYLLAIDGSHNVVEAMETNA